MKVEGGPVGESAVRSVEDDEDDEEDDAAAAVLGLNISVILCPPVRLCDVVTVVFVVVTVFDPFSLPPPPLIPHAFLR